jgi:ribosomal protein S18 acetylase RimI-like enzyme
MTSKASSYRYKFVDEAEFMPFFKENRSKIFANNVTANIRSIFSDDEVHKADALKANYKARRYYLFAYDGERIIGWSICGQRKESDLNMGNSAVLPEYRRQGVYSRLLENIILQATKDGFQEITSHHHCTNSDVIIAKLKAGFLISGFEIDDKFGTLVRLSYFTNKDRERLFRFRVGEQQIPTDLRQRLNMTLETNVG